MDTSGNPIGTIIRDGEDVVTLSIDVANTIKDIKHGGNVAEDVVKIATDVDKGIPLIEKIVETGKHIIQEIKMEEQKVMGDLGNLMKKHTH